MNINDLVLWNNTEVGKIIKFTDDHYAKVTRICSFVPIMKNEYCFLPLDDIKKITLDDLKLLLIKYKLLDKPLCTNNFSFDPILIP
jgi:hypothetical protein